MRADVMGVEYSRSIHTSQAASTHHTAEHPKLLARTVTGTRSAETSPCASPYRCCAHWQKEKTSRSAAERLRDALQLV
eukprot:6213139-Pleurochrysis_carterae.AAC.3